MDHLSIFPLHHLHFRHLSLLSFIFFHSSFLSPFSSPSSSTSPPISTPSLSTFFTYFSSSSLLSTSDCPDSFPFSSLFSFHCLSLSKSPDTSLVSTLYSSSLFFSFSISKVDWEEIFMKRINFCFWLRYYLYNKLI